MLYPVIRVKDQLTGYTHIVGENIHDQLYVDEDLHLQYLNTHCMAGTDGCDYTFVGKEEAEEPFPVVEFVTIDQLIDMAAEHLETATKAKIMAYKSLRERMDEEMQKARKETEIKFDTGGMLP